MPTSFVTQFCIVEQYYSPAVQRPDYYSCICQQPLRPQKPIQPPVYSYPTGNYEQPLYISSQQVHQVQPRNTLDEQNRPQYSTQTSQYQTLGRNYVRPPQTQPSTTKNFSSASLGTRSSQNSSAHLPKVQMAQQIAVKLNIDKQFCTANPKEETFSGRYDENWPLHRKNFILLCESYHITSTDIARLFRMTIAGSAFTLIDSHFP